jgi:hypothetical protein
MERYCQIFLTLGPKNNGLMLKPSFGVIIPVSANGLIWKYPRPLHKTTPPISASCAAWDD